MIIININLLYNMEEVKDTRGAAYDKISVEGADPAEEPKPAKSKPEERKGEDIV